MMSETATTPRVLTDDFAADLDAQLQVLDARARIERAAEVLGSRLVLSTSFGIQSAVMLHLANEAVPGIPVVFIDTGYLFPETYVFAEELVERLKLNLKVYNPQMTAARQEALMGKLWEQGVDGVRKYGLINKVEPMNRALKELGADAWLAGLRRVQSSTRRDLRLAQLQNRTLKIHPILDWSERDVFLYLQKHDLPYHPFWEQGYASVGDWHSSRPLIDGLTDEESRNNGIKRECGLHELSGNGDYQI